MSIKYYAAINCDGCNCTIDYCEPGTIRYWLKLPELSDVITSKVGGKVVHYCDRACQSYHLSHNGS